MNKLGVAILPDSKSHDYIMELVTEIKSMNIPYLKWNEKNTPHMTLFQGKFPDPNKAIGALQKLSLKLEEQKIKFFSVWISEWFFLEFEKLPDLVDLHNTTVDHLAPLRKGPCVDFLAIDKMTPGQRRSFSKTGYQFSYQEFNPHITLFQLVPKQHDTKQVITNLNKLITKREIIFDRYVLYRTGSGGACTDILLEKRL